MKKSHLSLLVVLLLLIGFGTGIITPEDLPIGSVIQDTEPITQPTSLQRERQDSLLLASFNIQVLGDSKLEKELPKQYLPAIIKQFDVIAIQELRDADGSTINTLQTWFPEYEIVYSERLGRTNSKEQYVLLYKPTKINIVKTEHINDEKDVFEREPYITVIQWKGEKISIVHNHLKPSDVENEMTSLEEIVNNIEGQVLVLGDLNADCSYYDENKETLPNLEEIIRDETDTTVGKNDCTYDRIYSNVEYIQAGVLNFQEEYDLSLEQAKIISDHYPVWIEIE